MSISRSVLFVLSMALPIVPSVVHLNSTAVAAVAAPDSRSAFIEEVRRDTEQFRDVRNAAPDYQPALGCVSGPDAGAMGVHFVNGTLLTDDYLAIDGRLDRIRLQVELALAREELPRLPEAEPAR